MQVHIASTALHYGQACFEGLKAFHCADEKVRIFRPDVNAERMAASSSRTCMPIPPKQLFLDMVKSVVENNLAFLPPYGSGGAQCIRPVLFGSGPKLRLQPSDHYTLIMLAVPVADYYAGSQSSVTAVVVTDYDRAAPRGVGHVKVAGNYAADLLPNQEHKKRGFPIALYLDAATHTYIGKRILRVVYTFTIYLPSYSIAEEFSTSNFIGITRSGTFVTPRSNAILPSITNRSLMQLAVDAGVRVEQRPVPLAEVLEGGMAEVGACGTAVVITPVGTLGKHRIYGTLSAVARLNFGLKCHFSLLYVQ